MLTSPAVAADAIRLSRRTLAVIKGNLIWAFAVNIAAPPLAAAGLLNRMIPGAAMAFSWVFVVSNSMRLPSARRRRGRRRRAGRGPPRTQHLRRLVDSVGGGIGRR
jgi:cation transport ATPase